MEMGFIFNQKVVGIMHRILKYLLVLGVLQTYPQPEESQPGEEADTWSRVEQKGGKKLLSQPVQNCPLPIPLSMLNHCSSQ